MQTPQNPDSANRPSSVAGKGTPAPGENSDGTPTVISTLRPSAANALCGLEGKRLGHFEILGAVGVGGMAAVLRAHDTQLDRVVALKILPPEMAADPENISRFKQEGRSAARLDHENIARVYFCGEDQGLHFIAFEFVEGDDLRAILARSGPLTPSEGVRYLLQLAAGLAHAAQRGVVHRDIKPSNILITPAGQAKIVDMGLARSTGAACGTLTQSGVTLGTFDYISPEQALEPREADVRSDIYSLGCTFYHVLTGQPPVPEGTAARKLQHHQNVEPIDPRQINPAIPVELVAVLARMMAKDPTRRYQTADELIQHVLHVAQILHVPLDPSLKNLPPPISPLPHPPRHSTLLVGLVGVAAVLLLALVIGLGGSSKPPPNNGRPSPVPPPDGPGTVAIVSNPPAPVDPGPPPLEQPKKASDYAELAKLLKEEEVETIVLTGADYSINDLITDAGKNDPVGVFNIRKLIVKPEAGNRPTIRLTADAMRPAEAALTLVGVGSDSSAEFHNIRFVIDADDSEQYAIIAKGLAKLVLVGCEFEQTGKTKAGGGAIRFEGKPTVGKSASLELSRCLFANGSVAVDAINRVTVKADDCAFGPHDILVRFKDTVVRYAPEAPLIADWNHCSARMGNGTAFQFEKNVSGTIRASSCVFARATDEPGESTLVRQTTPKGEVAFVGPNSPTAWRNVYYNVSLWAEGERTAKTAADAREQFSFKDEHLEELTRSPWKNPPPFAKLSAEAFALNPLSSQLRMPTDATAMLGVTHGPWENIYPGPLAPVDEMADPSAHALVVDPEHANENLRRFRNLASAVEAAKPGDTIYIAVNGPLDVPPLDLDQPDASLTIQAMDKFHPTLRMAETSKTNPAIVTVYDGSVTFKNLNFQLKASTGDKSKSRAVAAVLRAGEIKFQNCTATLDAADSGVQVALAAVTHDPDAAETDKVPTIQIKQTFIRGKGDLVSVRKSRSFNLEVENCLAALDGSMVKLGQSQDKTTAQFNMTFRKVTAFLNDPFLEIRAESDRKVGALAPSQVTCENCLFVPAGDKPYVLAVGMDGESLKQILSWGGHGNIYGNYGKMLHLELPENMKMIMPMMGDMARSDWLKFTGEPNNSFPETKVLAKQQPMGDRPFTAAQPEDFKNKFPECGLVWKELPPIDKE